LNTASSLIRFFNIYRDHPDFIPVGSFSRYSAAVQKSWMADDPNNGPNGNQLERRRSPTSLLFPAVENLSNEPGTIVLSCANAAVCTN
jgi:hypothetical protein